MSHPFWLGLFTGVSIVLAIWLIFEVRRAFVGPRVYGSQGQQWRESATEPRSEVRFRQQTKHSAELPKATVTFARIRPLPRRRDLR